MEDKIGIKGCVTVEVYRAKTGKREVICRDKTNLLTSAGRDWIHGQLYSTGTTDEAIYIAVSSNTGGVSSSHTSLASEISTSGLQRAAGTPSHTAGTPTTTVTKTFIAAGAFTAIQLTGLFTASSSGTLVHENTFTPVNLGTDDQLTVTWTITAA